MSNDNGAGNALRAASVIRNIAKGAAAGGLHGAAVGAVKSFLPEIIKAAVIIIATALLLPTLIFAALPNILFGYDNAFADDIITFTDKAYSIDAAYKKVDDFTLAEIERIVEETKKSYTSKEDGPAFDDVEVNATTDNTNIYWFIAINSVAHQQDLYSMSEDSIKESVISKIIFSTSIFSTIVGEGDDETTIRTLKIDIEDLDPEELMKKLGFSDEEKNWAKVLYSSMTEKQDSEYDSSDSTTYYGANYGNIVFTDTSTPVVYYNQFDSRWANLPYGKTGTISTSACGPSALAVVVSSLTSNQVTPPEVADWAVANGYRCEGDGSYRTLIPNGGAHYGLSVEGIGHDAEKLVDALSAGKLVIAIMAPGHFTKYGHYIVLRGITSDGKILVADTGSYTRSNQEWDLKLVLNEASRSNAAGGPFWVFTP
jgi:hypothetical protein